MNESRFCEVSRC